MGRFNKFTGIKSFHAAVNVYPYMETNVSLLLASLGVEYAPGELGNV
jgi:hypothetical protein